MNKMYYLHFNNLKKKKLINFEYISKTKSDGNNFKRLRQCQQLFFQDSIY